MSKHPNHPSTMPTRVLYLDLDGTVRHGKDEMGRFVNNSSDVRVFDVVPKILQWYRSNGWRIIGITNQGGVSLGIISYEDCRAAIMETQRQSGNAFDAIAACIHHPDAKNPEMAVCWCRKPRIGLIVEACFALARKTGECYPPHLALLVGDRPEDRKCAENAGVRFMDAKEWRDGGWRDDS